jgi:hypothetical protein
MARGAVNDQNSRAIADREARDRCRASCRGVARTRRCIARGREDQGHHGGGGPRGADAGWPMPTATAMATTSGRAVARPIRSMIVCGTIVLKPRVPDTTTACSEANGRNGAMARSTSATSCWSPSSASRPARGSASSRTARPRGSRPWRPGRCATITVARRRSTSVDRPVAAEHPHQAGAAAELGHGLHDVEDGDGHQHDARFGGAQHPVQHHEQHEVGGRRRPTSRPGSGRPRGRPSRPCPSPVLGRPPEGRRVRLLVRSWRSRRGRWRGVVGGEQLSSVGGRAAEAVLELGLR